jgi:hypothetical protein
MYIRQIILLGAALAISADRADINRYRTPVLPDAPILNSLPASGRSSDLFGPAVFISVVEQSPNKQTPLQPQSRLEIVR